MERYLAKISGPLVDRIDIHVDVPAVPFCELTSDRQGSSSAELAGQVVRARQRQETRSAETDVRSNSRMNRRQVRQFCPLDDDGHNMLKQAAYELGLSARTYDKVLKVARTIADIEGCDATESQHVAEAIQYHRLDRNL